MFAGSAFACALSSMANNGFALGAQLDKPKLLRLGRKLVSRGSD
ncbi:MAG TPA: hypothetical protein VER14_00740 [Phototrophicaceae bacterium]|nr:hypothetical protein [Phototrophicaceae bacterium]